MLTGDKDWRASLIYALSAAHWQARPQEAEWRATRGSLGKCWPAGAQDHTSRPAGHSPVAAHPAPWEPRLYIRLKQVCEPQGSPEAAEAPVPEAGSCGTHQGAAAPAPLCSLLTACFDQQLGSKHLCSYSPQVMGLSLRHLADWTPRNTSGNREFSIAESWSQAAPRVLNSPFCLRMRYTSAGVWGPCSCCPFSISFSSSLSVFQSWWRPA